jgi:prepilin-type N-terminal cleavage/methylation domain-containing protein
MKKRQGFSLIELLVVTAIVSLLSSLIMASVTKSRSRSRDARRIADIQQVMIALEIYFNANARYPVSTGCGATVPNNGWCNSVESHDPQFGWIRDSGAYGSLGASLQDDPVDPAPKTPTVATWNKGPGAYYYFSNTSATFDGSYILVYAVENYPHPLEVGAGVTDCTGAFRNYGTGSNGVITTGVSCMK